MATESVTPAVEPTPAIKPEAEGTGEKLAGKFDTPQDLEKAYLELQSKLGTPAESTPAADPKAEPAPTPEPKAEETPSESQPVYDEATTTVLTKAGLDPQEIASAYSENGSLSDDHYKALEEAGYPRALVDQHITTLNDSNAKAASESDALVAEVVESIGGDEAYKELTTFAAENYSDEQIEAYNAAVNSGNKHTAQLAVRGLQAEMQAANGKAPNLVQGGERPNADVYKSRYEMQTDMKDPRYRKDSAFTQHVQQKALRSNIFTQATK